MKLSLWNRVRGMRTKYQVRQALMKHVRDGFILSTLLAALSLIVALETHGVMRDRLVAYALHLEKTWVSCLNERGVYLDDKLHICSLVNTHFHKEDKMLR